MATASGEGKQDTGHITDTPKKVERQKSSLFGSLTKLEQPDLLKVCQNLEKALKNKDQQISEVNQQCDQLMTLYLETTEKLAASNRELRICQDQLKQHENSTRTERHDDDQSDYDSNSLVSENTDQELAEISNDDDNDYDYEEDDDEDDETETDTSGGSVTTASAMTLPSATLTNRSSRAVESGRSRKNVGLSKSLRISPETFNSEDQGLITAVPTSAIRARRHNKRVASSCHDLSDKVYPVLHRRDPTKSRFDVMKAELVGVDSENAPRYIDGQDVSTSREIARSESRSQVIGINKTKLPPEKKEPINATRDEHLNGSQENCDNIGEAHLVQAISNGISFSHNIPQNAKITNGVQEMKDTPTELRGGSSTQSGSRHELESAVQSGNEETKTPQQAVPSPFPRRSKSRCSKSAVFDAPPSRPLSRITTLTSLDLSKVKAVPSARVSSAKSNGDIHGQKILKPVLSNEPINSPRSSPWNNNNNSRSVYKPLPQIDPANHAQKTTGISTDNVIPDNSKEPSIKNGTDSMDKDSLEYTSHSLSSNSKSVEQLVN